MPFGRFVKIVLVRVSAKYFDLQLDIKVNGSLFRSRAQISHICKIFATFDLRHVANGE